jgi:ABC-type multidrug transport system fused ATPase/permease subunit
MATDVLKEGRVAESGTHNQLMAKRALYYELVHQQSLA